jgi:hypothetical protein
MPQEDGRLTEAEKAKFRYWLEQRSGFRHKCSVCLNESWTIGDHLVMPVSFFGDFTVRFSGVSYPQAMLICNVCAHTQFFNAVRIGLVPAALNKDVEDQKKKNAADGR